MASDKSMYWLAAAVLALGVSTRYGHSADSWAACPFQRATSVMDNVADRVLSQAQRNVNVMVLSDRQICANDRAAAAAQVIARREAVNARVQAALTRVDHRVLRIDDDSE